MYTVLLTIVVVLSLLLILVIMVQNPKGGGLSSEFGGTQMLGGVQKTSDFLDKSTWVLSIMLICVMLLSNTVAKFSLSSSVEDSSLINKEAPVVPYKKNLPKSPAPVR